ncbi:MAG: NAD-dependent protein deacylase [Treponema sp.]|nr:NAD-dependent protein deacylase [Treponema sp.]
MDPVKIEILQKMYDDSENIVFFGGAGVSTESGIPDFRSVDGLYNQKWDYPPETILSRTFFDTNRPEFFRFYREKILIEGIKPNKAHTALAAMEKAGKLSAVITQNIDGLHQMAGSQSVYELHGSTLRNNCMSCKKFFDVNYMNNKNEAYPVCDVCGGIVKPDVVLYEEGLDDDCVNGAVEAISKADMLIIGGTSLTVYPAAGLIRYFQGKYLVLINKGKTQADQYASLVIHDSIGETLGSLKI